MLPVMLASAEAYASKPPCDGSLPQSFSTIDGLSWPIDMTAALARSAMLRIEEPDFAVNLSTGFVAGAIAICTEADARDFLAGSLSTETSTDGEADASLTLSVGAGATPSGEAAANRSLNITEGTEATGSIFGAAAVACSRSPNTVV